MAKSVLKVQAENIRRASAAYTELYNDNGLQVWAVKSGKFEVKCGSTRKIAHNLQEVEAAVDGLNLHQFPSSGAEVRAAIHEKLGQHFKLEIRASKDNTDKVVHTITGTKDVVAAGLVGVASMDVEKMAAGVRYAMPQNMYGGDYMMLIPMNNEIMELSPSFVEPQMYEPQEFAKGQVLHGICPLSHEVVSIIVDEAYPNGTLKAKDGTVYSSDDVERMQFAIDRESIATEDDFHEPDELLYQPTDIPSYNPVGVVKDQAPVLGNLANYDSILNASAGVISDFMKTVKGAAYLDRSSLNKVTVSAIDGEGQATAGSVEWNCRVASPSYKRTSNITIPLTLVNGSIDIGKEFIISTGQKFPMSAEGLQAHLGSLAEDDMFRHKAAKQRVGSAVHADRDVNNLLRGVTASDMVKDADAEVDTDKKTASQLPVVDTIKTILNKDSYYKDQGTSGNIAAEIGYALEEWDGEQELTDLVGSLLQNADEATVNAVVEACDNNKTAAAKTAEILPLAGQTPIGADADQKNEVSASKKTAALSEEGTYASLTELPNGDLSIKVTDLGREELPAMLEKSKDENYIMPDLLEDIFANSSWGMVQPEDIGALTSAPIIGYDMLPDDEGNISSEGKVWWYPNYAVSNAMEELLEKGETIFTSGNDEVKTGSKAVKAADDSETADDTGDSDVSYDAIKDMLDEKLLDAFNTIADDYELTNAGEVETKEIEHASRDGFIPFTDGGVQVDGFTTVEYLTGSGTTVPNVEAQKDIDAAQESNYTYAKEEFIKKYPELVEKLGVENIYYNELYNAGYSSEAEELSEMERGDGEDTVMFIIKAQYYAPGNGHSDNPDTHSLYMRYAVNTDFGYHHESGENIIKEEEFAFNDMATLESKVDEFLANLDSKYVHSSKKVKADGEDLGTWAEHVESTSQIMTLSEAGITLDLDNWEEAKKEFENMIAQQADFKEGSAKAKKLNLVASNGWPEIRGKSENTYNWSYLGPTCQFGVCQGNDELWYGYALVHQGGDVRGNYGLTYFFNQDNNESEDAAFDRFGQSFMELISGSITFTVNFDDGSSFGFWAEQDSDIPYYSNEGRLNGTADSLAGIFSNLAFMVPQGLERDSFIEDVKSNDGAIGSPEDAGVDMHQVREDQGQLDMFHAPGERDPNKHGSKLRALKAKFDRRIIKAGKDVKATGEADQDYDIEMYDKVVEQLTDAGFTGATHKEFDKYQGVYLNVPGVDKFWIDEVFTSGTRTDKPETKKYRRVKLISPDGDTLSATPGDYFQLPADHVFEECTLVLTLADGSTEEIQNPKKSDLPKDEDVAPTTFIYEKGSETSHYILIGERNPELGGEITVKGEDVDASELINAISSAGFKPKGGQSKTRSSKAVKAAYDVDISKMYKPGLGEETLKQIKSYNLSDLEREPGRYEIIVDTISSGANGIYQPVQVAKFFGIFDELVAELKAAGSTAKSPSALGTEDEDLIIGDELSWDTIDSVANKLADQLNRSEKVAAPYDNGSFYFGHNENDGSYELFYGWDSDDSTEGDEPDFQTDAGLKTRKAVKTAAEGTSDLKSDLVAFINSCVEGYTGEWDTSSDAGRDGFLDMYTLLEGIEKFAETDETALSLINGLKNSCTEGMDGTWDTSTPEGREGFLAMRDDAMAVAQILDVDTAGVKVESSKKTAGILADIMGGQNKLPTTNGNKSIMGVSAIIHSDLPEEEKANILMNGKPRMNTLRGEKSIKGIVDMLKADRAANPDSYVPIVGVEASKKTAAAPYTLGIILLEASPDMTEDVAVKTFGKFGTVINFSNEEGLAEFGLQVDSREQALKAARAVDLAEGAIDAISQGNWGTFAENHGAPTNYNFVLEAFGEDTTNKEAAKTSRKQATRRSLRPTVARAGSANKRANSKDALYGRILNILMRDSRYGNDPTAADSAAGLLAMLAGDEGIEQDVYGTVEAELQGADAATIDSVAMILGTFAGAPSMVASKNGHRTAVSTKRPLKSKKKQAAEDQGQFLASYSDSDVYTSQVEFFQELIKEDPEQYDMEAGASDEDIEAKAKELAEDDIDAYQIALDDTKIDLDEAFSRLNEQFENEGLWEVEGRAMGWQQRSGDAVMKIEGSDDFFKMFPGTQDFSFDAREFPGGVIEVKISHHDAPMGEFRTLRPYKVLANGTKVKPNAQSDFGWGNQDIGKEGEISDHSYNGSELIYIITFKDEDGDERDEQYSPEFFDVVSGAAQASKKKGAR